MGTEDEEKTVAVGFHLTLEPDGKIDPANVAPAMMALFQQMMSGGFDKWVTISGSVVEGVGPREGEKSLRIEARRGFNLDMLTGKKPGAEG